MSVDLFKVDIKDKFKYFLIIVNLLKMSKFTFYILWFQSKFKKLKKFIFDAMKKRIKISLMQRIEVVHFITHLQVHLKNLARIWIPNYNCLWNLNHFSYFLAFYTILAAIPSTGYCDQNESMYNKNICTF